MAFIGQTDYTKVNLQNTVVIPGLVNCGAEVINIKASATNDIYLTDTDKMQYITNETESTTQIRVIFSNYAPAGRVIEFIFDLAANVDVTFIFPKYAPANKFQTVRALAGRNYLTVSTNSSTDATFNGTSYDYSSYLIPSAQISGHHVTDICWIVNQPISAAPV